jgi:hypothetical protein
MHAVSRRRRRRRRSRMAYEVRGAKALANVRSS